MKKIKKVISAIVLFILIQSVCQAQTIRIRTVVHVLYTNASNNVSDATVLNYINEVNKGFAKQLTPAFTRTSSIFDTLWANTDVQLCLATLDANGAATNGITHDLITNSFQDSQNPVSPVWDANSYFNIYLAPVYAEPGFPSFVIGGWASTPTKSQPGATFNYVVVATNSIPFIPQLLTHEIGHVFGMDHLNTDLIADTPKGIENVLPSVGYSSVCSSALQNANTTTLAQDGMHWGGVDPPNMVENFMGLSFCCSYMFTKGQKNVMQAYIQNHLSNWINSNCNSTSLVEDLGTTGSIRVFPNPATDSFTIAGASSFLQTIKILDVCGREMRTLSVNKSQEVVLQKGDLPAGIYFLQMTDASERITTRKIVIQ